MNLGVSGNREMNEKETFELMTNRILSVEENKEKPILIAINGIEGARKTVMDKYKLLAQSKFESLSLL